MTKHNVNVVELTGSEIEEVNGGLFWVPLAALVALAGLALAAYEVGKDDGQCH